MKYTTEQRSMAQGTPHGFTVVELAVVLVIFGIVLAAAVPSFTHRNAWVRLEGSARELSSRIQLARQAAVAQRVPYRVLVDSDDHSFTVERQENDSTWTREPDQVFRLEGVQEMTMVVGDSLESDEILIETRGTVDDSSAPARIRLLSAQSDTAVVVVVRTGRVTTRMASGS